jgi:hypothetical protein
MDNKVKELSESLAFRSLSESAYFPADRAFMQKNISDILAVNKLDFILYNLERVSNTYTIKLFVCLPELWEDIDLDDIITLINSFTNTFSYYSLIEFTYKFLEINLIDFIMSMEKTSVELKRDLKRHLKSQYPYLIKDEEDYFLFQKKIFGDIESFRNIKERLLLDNRVKPALQSFDELKQYVEYIIV